MDEMNTVVESQSQPTIGADGFERVALEDLSSAEFKAARATGHDRDISAGELLKDLPHEPTGNEDSKTYKQIRNARKEFNAEKRKSLAVQPNESTS